MTAPPFAKWVARWVMRTVLGACALVGSYHLIVPRLVTNHVRRTLSAAGYPDARFAITQVGLSKLELADVWLRDGLALGDVTVGAGLTQLWRHDRFDVDLRGPQVTVASAEALETLTATTPVTPKVRRVRITAGKLAVANDQLLITGTIDLGPASPTVDVVATAADIQVGRVHATDAVAELHARNGKVHVCATATVHGALAKACTQATTLDPSKLRELDVTWTARDVDATSWSARGSGRLVRTGDSFSLRDGHADVVSGDVRIDAKLDGDLTGLSIRGSAHATRIATEVAVLHQVQVPFSFRAVPTGDGLALTGDAPVVVRAKSAVFDVRGTEVTLDDPFLTARGQLALADGQVNVRTSADELIKALQLTVHVRGLKLAPVLQIATGGHVHGTGLLDGELQLELVDDTWGITGGSMRARGAGRLRASDPEWRKRAAASVGGYAVHQRVAAALGDFRYSQLAFVLGKKPELQLIVKGHGAKIPQQIELVLNVRGLHSLARRAGLAQLGGAR